jgi:hypothetical protein
MRQVPGRALVQSDIGPAATPHNVKAIFCFGKKLFELGSYPGIIGIAQDFAQTDNPAK